MINVGIFGFGNVAKALVENSALFEDINIVAIFSRHASGLKYSEIPIYKQEEFAKFKNKIDVMFICVGSRLDAPKYASKIAEMFNTIDCYDDHKSMRNYVKKIDASAKIAKTTSVVATGWDPGLFSLSRCILDAVLPNGYTQTFWGKGISQGHSEAIRKIKGVVDARQYTVPNKNAIKKFEKEPDIKLSDTQKHLRLCYVVLDDKTNKNEVISQIKNMPHYFQDYKTKVNFVDKKTIIKKHNRLYHAGFVERISRINGIRHMIKFELKTDSNAHLTSSIMLAYVKAVIKLNKENKYGAYTILDIPPRYIINGNPIKYI